MPGHPTDYQLIYKITCPYGEAYSGSDLTDMISYFDISGPDLTAADFARK